MPNLKVQNLNKVFEKAKVCAAKEINLTVNEGEYLTLLGPSGCGKTVFVRMIAGLESIDSGKIYIDDKPINEIPTEDRDIGMVFQSYEIFPFMDVWDNVAYPGIVRRWPKEKIETETVKALEVVGLLDRAGEFPDQLSVPDLQRIAIARTLVTGSKLLLLDEPLSSLDQRYSEEFRHELRRLVKDLGLTAVHITHNQDEAMMISDRIVIMRKGEFLQAGTPAEIYEHPNSIFVANFIGESNFLDGNITEIKDEGSIITLRHDGPKIISSNKEFKRDTRIVASIRKELVKIYPADSDKQYTIEAKVKNIIFLGSFLRVFCELSNEDIVEAKITFPPKFELNKGDKVHVKMHPDNILLFEYPDDLAYELALD